MRTSQFPLNTVKETPADAEIASHKLMIRAGLIRKLASGLYTWLPLGLRVLRKVEQMTRAEMEKVGALEVLMHNIKMFDRADALSTDGFEGSGADWLDNYKEYISGGNVVVVSPHKLYGPESNDLALQLRKHGFNKVILAGMSANLCTESHLRELVENGFEVAVVKDATAAAATPML